ncbi:exosporium protein C [Cohnella sp. CFH 77786]|uniref:exosporium protein C n=1 Tax=Cohnella sp. CFH 77786 TaxID=2662265 RepID=UPI001C608168|nr:exosporium protein C [Cohnella sp. CFH 77786]MBW5447710.1 exosporium protein C [Cohnella sp. CFH 77786]
MARLLNKSAVEPRRAFDLTTAYTIRRSPNTSLVASLVLTIPANAQPNRVELVATVGVRGVTGIAQVLFQVTRDGMEIFSTVQGVESSGSEQNYVITFQAIDRNVATGRHVYQVLASNLTANTRVDVVGPVSFSALAVQI